MTGGRSGKKGDSSRGKSKLPIFIITETEPTPLLHDFATFIQYLRTHHITLTRVNEFIPGKNLYELNQRMTHPISDTTTRTDQTRYPLLHLFYHLSLAGKLFQRVPGKGSRLALKPTERLQAYEELKPAEKYFFLLETLWVDADWEKLQVGYFWHSFLYTVPEVFKYLSECQPGKEIQVRGEDAPDIAQMLLDWNYFLLYFSYFGFWEVKRDTDSALRDLPKHYFSAESIMPSTFGVTLAKVLSETRDFFRWNLPYRRKQGEWRAIPGSPCEEHFFLSFVPLFPEGELQKTLPREGVKFVDGTYVFKVSLAKDLWRRIEISAEHTLLDLHRAIQRAYNFDDDHLYSFFMDGRAWSYERFVSPYEEEGPWVDDVRIGELGLFIGQNILYLFDYGDEWHFRVELEEIRTEGRKPRKPKIIEKEGKAPKQYEE